jgi:hypothetical protein
MEQDEHMINSEDMQMSNSGSLPLPRDRNLYFTTQDISQVDIRLRKQLDFLAYCTQTIYQDFFKVKMIDYRDVLNIRTNTFVYNGAQYYDLYDTTEIIDFTNKEYMVEEEKEGDIMDTVKGEIKKVEKIEAKNEGIVHQIKKKEVRIKPRKVDDVNLDSVISDAPGYVKNTLGIPKIDKPATKYVDSTPKIYTNVTFPKSYNKPKEKTRDEIIADIDAFLKKRESQLCRK